MRDIPIKKSRAFLVSLSCTVLILFCLVESMLRLKEFPPIYVMNEAGWFQNFKSMRDYPDSTDFVLYGSSRILEGVSPESFVEQLKILGRTARCRNLGHVGTESLGLLAHVKENKYTDIVIIEQLGSMFSRPLNWNDWNIYYRMKSGDYFGAWFEEKLKHGFKKNILFFREGIVRSFLGVKNYRFGMTHSDGWLELRFNHDSRVLKNSKAINDGNVENLPILKSVAFEEARKNREIYLGYFRKIIDQGSQVVILRMPSDGKFREYEDKLLSQDYFTEFFRDDENILYIDSTIHPMLSKYKTIENIHLDADVVKDFSRDLATIIQEWLTIKRK